MYIEAGQSWRVMCRVTCVDAETMWLEIQRRNPNLFYGVRMTLRNAKIGTDTVDEMEPLSESELRDKHRDDVRKGTARYCDEDECVRLCLSLGHQDFSDKIKTAVDCYVKN